MKASSRLIREKLVQVTGSDFLMEIEDDSSLLNAGIDSLQFAEFLMSIEEEFDVRFPEEEEFNYDTIEKVLLFLKSLN